MAYSEQDRAGRRANGAWTGRRVRRALVAGAGGAVIVLAVASPDSTPHNATNNAEQTLQPVEQNVAANQPDHASHSFDDSSIPWLPIGGGMLALTGLSLVYLRRREVQASI